MNCGWLQTCLIDIKKHKTLEMLLRADFYAFFKILHFSRSSVVHTKVVEIILFLAEHGRRTRKIWINPFCNDFPLSMLNFKNQFYASFNDCFKFSKLNSDV